MITLLLLIAAFICFILAMTRFNQVPWVPLGLALVTLSWILTALGVHT